jgi:hypothetical protein
MAIVLVATTWQRFDEVAEQDRPWVIGVLIVIIYGLFFEVGIFSIYDVPGWLANLCLPTAGRRPPRIVVMPATKQADPAEKKRIGVVFAGGGGKGAYQIGCYKELVRRGIAVGYMSGSSVGALNIAMLLHGARAAEALWRSLSASQLMSCVYRKPGPY